MAKSTTEGFKHPHWHAGRIVPPVNFSAVVWGSAEKNEKAQVIIGDRQAGHFVTFEIYQFEARKMTGSYMAADDDKFVMMCRRRIAESSSRHVYGGRGAMDERRPAEFGGPMEVR